MKQAAILFFVFWSIFALNSRAEDVELAAQWPLTQSLFSTTGSVDLFPYGGGAKLPDSAVVYNEDAVELGEITLFGTPMLDVSEGIAVTGWVKPKEIEGGFSRTAPHTLIYLYDSRDRGGTQFVFRILDGKLNAFNAMPAKNVFSSFATPVDEWSFFAFVLKSDAVDIYLNHYPPQRTEVRNAYQYDRIYIGAMSTGLARPFRGLMKHVRLYSGALNAEDIRKIYKAESGK